MKKKSPVGKIILILIVLALIGGFAYFYFNRDVSVNYTKETARTMTLETYYTFSGNIEPGSVTTVTATAAGTVKEWLVEEGEFVEDGDTVMRSKGNTSYNARRDGTISNIFVKADDSYSIGAPLYRIADYAHPLIHVRVDEYDVSALKKGMSVSVKIQATGEIVSGRITRIAKEATVVNDMAFYDAEISIDNENLVMGLTCEISVLRASAENATTVSTNAVQYDDHQNPYLYVYDRNGEIVEQRVTLGINNGSLVEIKEGVRSGETVLIPPMGMNEMFAQMVRMRRNR